MRACRLSAIYKTENRDTVRPVTSGESMRRAVGSSMIEVAKDRIEDLFLSFNQFSFTADGCQLIYNLARQLLAENPR